MPNTQVQSVLHQKWYSVSLSVCHSLLSLHLQNAGVYLSVPVFLVWVVLLFKANVSFIMSREFQCVLTITLS